MCKTQKRILRQREREEKEILDSCEDGEVASGRGGQELVTLDPCGDASAAIVRLDSQNASIAPDVDIAGQRDLLRKSEDELDRTACLNGRFDRKIQPAEADVAGFGRFLDYAILGGEANLQRKHHRKTSRRTALDTVFHETSLAVAPNYHRSIGCAMTFRGEKGRLTLAHNGR
jgi:hypothetical protein